MEDTCKLTFLKTIANALNKNGVASSSSAISWVKVHVVSKMLFSAEKLIFMSNTYLKSKICNRITGNKKIPDVPRHSQVTWPSCVPKKPTRAVKVRG